jgi:naphthalene 1,2-dioxygenase ferredoxin reductase component
MEVLVEPLQRIIFAGWRAYLCGSPPMVEAATRLVRRKGIAAEQVYADAFYTQGV